MLSGNALPVMLTVIFTTPWQEYDSNQFSFTVFDNSIEKQHYTGGTTKRQRNVMFEKQSTPKQCKSINSYN